MTAKLFLRNYLLIMIRAISTIRSSNSKGDYELRKLHESLSKRIRVIREIRSRL